jgi:3-phosphoshikimate 1-carboxyvinyltransferase
VTTLVVHPATRPLVGSVPVPPDRRIERVALILGALADGRSRIRGLSRGSHDEVTARGLRALGVVLDETPAEVVVHGVGLRGLRVPETALDCGRSPATLAMLAGVLAAQPFAATLTGSEGLLATPSARLVGPLRARGAVIRGRRPPTLERDILPPLTFGPLPEERELAGLEQRSETPDDEVKSALLLSGLRASGPTIFREPTVSRDHTERMLGTLGVPIRTVGAMVMLDPAGWDGRWPALDVAVPGDLSAAALLVVAAQLVPGSSVVIRGVGTNATRAGFLDLARDLGAGLRVEAHGEQNGEPVGTLHAWSTDLRPAAIGGETAARALDDLAAGCALAARARGTTRVLDVRGQHQTSVDRLAGILEVLRAFGVGCESTSDGLEIEGRREPLDPAEIPGQSDPRVAMMAAVLALGGRGPSRIRDADAIAGEYPKFVATLRALGARIELEA